MCERTKGLKSSDILLLYDNCKSHVSGFSNWYMMNIRAYKISNVTYTPEFNMIERFFNTLKHNASDGIKRE